MTGTAMSEPPDGWRGRVALVTGGHGAIGQAVAGDLAGRGVTIHLADLSASREVRHGISHTLDVGDETAVARLVADILAQHGTIDFLVHCAGVFTSRPFAQIGRHWQHTLRANLTSAFLCLREVLPTMRARRFGAVVLVSSMLARTGAVGAAHYAASKAGLLGLARSAALENADHGVRVNTVSPGVTDTPQPREHHSEQDLRRLAEAIPLGRIATTTDVADAVSFLLSPASSYLTGQDIRLSGGRALW